MLDCSMTRTALLPPLLLSYELANRMMASEGASSPLNRAAALLQLWGDSRTKNSEAAANRQRRLDTRGASNAGFSQSAAHKLVNTSLELYSYAAAKLALRDGVVLPRMPGSGASKGGRVGTAPLRRVLDCFAQRQLMAGLLGYGGDLMTGEECRDESLAAGIKRNAMNRHI